MKGTKRGWENGKRREGKDVKKKAFKKKRGRGDE